MRNQSHRSHWILSAVLGVCLLALGACGGGGSSTGTPIGGGTDTGGGGTDGGGQTGSLAVAGGLEFTVQNKPVKIDYSGGKAEVSMVHKKSTGITCVSAVEMKISLADGSCELKLIFDVGVASDKELVQAELHAVKAIKQAGTVLQTIPCAAWPGVEGATDEKVYTLDAGKGELKAGPIQAPESTQALAVLKGQVLAPKGQIKLRNKGDAVVVDLGTLTVTGDVQSVGSEAASCGTTTGEKKCATEGNVGNAVGDLMKRKPFAYMCEAPAVEYDFGELCGHDAVWVTIYRRWSDKACGGCDNGQICFRKDNPNNTWTPGCGTVTTDCAAGCGDDKVCIGGTCYAKVADGEDMSLKDELAAYKEIYDSAGKDVKLAAAVIVAEGLERARGKCTETEPGKLTCDGEGPASTPEDCAAVREKFKIPDDVILLFDPNKKLWSSNDWFGPQGYSNGMFITNSELKIVAAFPVSGQPPPGSAGVITAIKDAADK